jgi:hypothetical protein
MAVDKPQVIALLKGLKLFSGLDNTQLDRVAEVTELVSLKEGENLSLDETRDYPFFVVASGKVRQTRPLGGGKEEIYVLKQGDFFGADILFLGVHRKYQVNAMMPTQLLRIEAEQLRPLVNAIPPLTKNLKTQIGLYRLIRSKPFNWLGEDETVQLIRRKHPAFLLVTELIPLGVAWVGVLVILFSTLIGVASFRLVVSWLGIAVLAAAALWSIWRYLDWGNDYYIVTDQRIVWLERIIWLYDSRQEAPLIAIKAGETKSTLSGRWFGFGDVITQAFMGQVIFRHVGNPGEIKDLIDQQRKLALIRQSELDTKAIEGVIRQKIEPPPPPPDQPEPEAPTQAGKPAAQEAKKTAPRQSFWQSFAASFQTRMEAGGTITYRRNLYVLFTRTFLPALIGAGVLFGAAYLYYLRTSDRIGFPTPLTIIFLGIFLMLVPVLWWLYKFVDWSNDIYSITADKIVDSERKPLGTEITKSAPLESIIGLDYERLGLLGILFNFGNVIINVGTDNKFIFYEIHDPARAQRDIFNYMYEQRRKKQTADAKQEWERVSDWLAAYHRQAEDLRQSGNPPQS